MQMQTQPRTVSRNFQVITRNMIYRRGVCVFAFSFPPTQSCIQVALWSGNLHGRKAYCMSYSNKHASWQAQQRSRAMGNDERLCNEHCASRLVIRAKFCRDLWPVGIGSASNTRNLFSSL